MLFARRKRRIARILIVEDEPLVAFDNETSLTADGYTVVATVDNLTDAAAILDAQPVDLVLTDIALSGDGDGLDVARHAAGAGVPVLFVTGSCPPAARTLAIGALAKPYNDRTLKAALGCIDRLLGGDPPGKPPPGLTLFAPTDSRP